VKLYGLTGGPGMGKSEAARVLVERGVAVIDTDDVAREVVEPGQSGLEAVRREFGAEVIATDGTLNREALAAKVFQESSARTQLEGILHPLIRQRWLETAKGWRAKGLKAGVVVIPLLFETGAEQEFERVICIACSAQLQSARLHERGWNAAQVTGRLSAQWPIDRKIDRSQYVVWNDSSIEVLREQLGRVPPLKGSE
jgi:dephospho-CoA kinase